MSRLRTLHRIVDARKRLRDIAAGAVAIAEAQHSADRIARDTDAARIDEVVDAAALELASGGGVAVLELLAIERQAAARALAIASERVRKSRAETEQRQGALTAKERELRLVEELRERARDARDAKVAKAEQTLNDDLASARVRRSR